MRLSRPRRILTSAAFLLLLAGRGGERQAAGTGGVHPAGPGPRSVTLPFALDHNRMIVDAEFLRPDGTVRKARAWVDTGNQHFLLGESLARDLGLDLSGPKEEGTQYAEVAIPGSPPVRLAGMALDVEGIATQALIGARTMPGVPAEANIPASVLRHSHVVFDYPRRRLTVAKPGVLKPRGAAVPCRVNPETGLFQIAATADGEIVQLGVDNGSAGTWFSDTLTKAWQARHPDWPQATGAVGSANFFGFGFEAKGALMSLPELGIGQLRARDVGLLGLMQGLFDWYSKKTPGPVSGFIGANVLTEFRLEVDFPAQMTYWEAGPRSGPRDMDVVGLTLRPEVDGRFTVVGVEGAGGKPAEGEILPGDKLLRVGRLETLNATMGQVVSALRGRPGETRELLLEREGRNLAVKAVVRRWP